MRRGKRIAALCAAALAALGLCGCAKTGDTLPPGPDPDVDPVLIAYDPAGDMTVFSRILGEADGGNVLFSPYSLKDAVSILYPGMSGMSRRQAEEALGMGGGMQLFLEAYDKDLAASDSGVKSVSRVYVNDSYVVHTEKLRADDVKAVPFGSESDRAAAVNDVNAFVSENTEGKIPVLLEERDISADTNTVSVNALYFKREWDFEAGSDAWVTWEGGDPYKAVSYYDSGGEWAKNVKEYGGIDVTRLPYKGSPGYSMILITDGDGAEREGVMEFLTGLDDAGLTELADFSNYRPEESYDEVSVIFPVFEAETRQSVKQAVADAGAAEMFRTAHDDGSQNLDFSAIIDPGENDGRMMVAGDIIQACFVRADETGTEAAAATGVVTNDATAMAEPEPVRVKRVVADSPFAFLIRDDASGAVLFMGFIGRLDLAGEPYAE